MDKKDLVLDTILKSEKPLKVGDIERLTGLSRNEIQKILNDLYFEKKIQYPDRCHNKVIAFNKEE